MKKLLFLLIFFGTFFDSFGQYVPFGGKAADTSRTFNLEVTGRVRFSSIRANGDTTFTGVTDSGRVYRLTKTDVIRWAASAAVAFDSTSLSIRINQKEDVANKTSLYSGNSTSLYPNLKALSDGLATRQSPSDTSTWDATISDLNAALSALTTTNVSEGSNQYFTQARVRATPLTGLSTAINSAITASDDVLTAMGKLQAQITAGGGSSGMDLTTNQTVTTGIKTFARNIVVDSIYGGTFAGQDLWLLTTSNATKGKIYLGENSYFDNANHVLRHARDGSNYWTATVSSTGGINFDAVGSGAAFGFNDPVTLGTGSADGRLNFGTGGSNYIAGANRTDVSFNSAGLSARGGRWTAWSTTAVDPSSYPNGLFNFISTSLAPIVVAYDQNNYTTFTPNLTGGMVINQVGTNPFTEFSDSVRLGNVINRVGDFLTQGGSGNSITKRTAAQVLSDIGALAQSDTSTTKVVTQSELNTAISGISGGTSYTANYVGIVWRDSFARGSLGSNYTSTTPNSTFTMTGTYLRLDDNGTSPNTFTNYITTAFYKGYQRFTPSVKFSVPKKGSGMTLGFKSITASSSNQNLQVQIAVDSNASTRWAFMHLWSNGTLIKLGTDSLKCLNTDTMELVIERDRTKFTYYLRNPSNNTTISDAYEYTLDYPFTWAMPNMSQFQIFNHGGVQHIYEFKITSKAQKGVKAVFCGDSELDGYFTSNVDTRYPEVIYGGRYEQFEVQAGGNETSADALLRLPQIVNEIAPNGVIFYNYGINDASQGVSAATFGANVDSFVRYCQAAGKTVVLGTLIPTSVNNTTEANYNTQIATVGTNRSCTVVDLYNSSLNNGSGGLAALYNCGDNLHINRNGNTLIATILRPYFVVDTTDRSLFAKQIREVKDYYLAVFDKGTNKLGYIKTTLSGSSFSVSPIGSSPNGNGASYTSGIFQLQPADATNGGVLTAGSQQIGGAKTLLESLTISKNQNAATSLSINNTNTGSSSQAAIILNTTASLFKTSSGYTPYKTIGANDLGFYNNTAGNISILNDFGKVMLTAGGRSTPNVTINEDDIINIADVPEYADNADATADGLSDGDIYRTGDQLKIVH